MKRFLLPEVVKAPLDYFSNFLYKSLIDIIVTNTLYSTQMRGLIIGVITEDVIDFLSVELLMCVVQMPA